MKNFEKIQRYLNKNMNSSEQEAFEKECALNKDLSLEVELQRQENLALESLAIGQLKKKIQDLDVKRLKSIQESEKNLASSSKFKFKSKVWLLLIPVGVLSLMTYQFFCKSLKSKNSEFKKIEAPKVEDKENSPSLIEDTIQRANNRINKTSNQIDGKINKPTKSELNKQDNIKKESKPKPTSKPKPISKPKTKERLKDIDYKLIAMSNMPTDISNLRGAKIEKDIGGRWAIINGLISAEKYDLAIDSISALSTSDPYYLDAQLLKAKSLMKISNYDEATLIYESLIKEGDPFIIDIYQYELLVSLIGQLPSTSENFNTLFKNLDSNIDFTYKKELEKIKSDLQKVNYSFE